MKLTQISTGQSKDVTIPSGPLVWLRTIAGPNGSLATVGEKVEAGQPDWFNALQQWALSQGYEPPEKDTK